MKNALLPRDSTGDAPKQKLFVEAYTGDANKDADRLGIPHHVAQRWERAEWFIDALAKREQREVIALRRDNIYQRSQAIMARLEIQAMWSDIASDTTKEPKDRLKASELLAKSHGLLLEKVVHEGNPEKPIMMAKIDVDDRLQMILAKVIRADVIDPMDDFTPVGIPSQPLETSDEAEQPAQPSASSEPGKVS